MRLESETGDRLRIEIDTSLPAGRVVRALELMELRGKPLRIRLDNGLELVSQTQQTANAVAGRPRLLQPV